MRAFIASLILNGFLISGCSHFYPDNPIEELAEEGIREVTGLDIDLSVDDEKLDN